MGWLAQGRTAGAVVLALTALATGCSKSTSAQGHPQPTHSAVAQVQADLRAALAATTWPTINPPFSLGPDGDTRGCAQDAVPPIPHCTWGNASATHTIYLVGDSTSGSYIGAFSKIISTIPTWKLVVRSDSGCPFSTMPAPEGNGLDPDAGAAACTEHDNKVVDEINAQHPDVVVFTSVSGAAARIPGKQAELARIEKAVGRIIVLPTSPPLKNPQTCYRPGGSPTACVTPLPAAYGGWLKNFAQVASAVHGTFIDPTALFCADGRCPVFVKTIPKTKDGVHMTVSYSQYLAPALHELFHNDGILP